MNYSIIIYFDYPLWNLADFCQDTWGYIIYKNYVDYLPFCMDHTSHHFHNNFKTTQQLLTKYQSYGHSKEGTNDIANGCGWNAHWFGLNDRLCMESIIGKECTFQYLVTQIIEFEGSKSDWC